MAVHVVELILWLLLAFLAGAIIGCLLGRGGRRQQERGEKGPDIRHGKATSAAAAQQPAGSGDDDADAGRNAEDGGPDSGQKAAARQAAARSQEKEAQETQKAGTGKERDATDASGKAAPPAGGGMQALAGDGDGGDGDVSAAGGAAAGQGDKGDARQDASKESAETGKTSADTANEAVPDKEDTGKKDSGKKDSGRSDDRRDARWTLPVVGLTAPQAGEPDNLQLISGVGPKLEKMLHEMGIYYFAQIARWDDKVIEEVDARLKFKGRITRDEWVRQAQLLAEGRMEEFARDYGSGGLKDASGKTRTGARTRRKK